MPPKRGHRAVHCIEGEPLIFEVDHLKTAIGGDCLSLELLRLRMASLQVLENGSELERTQPRLHRHHASRTIPWLAAREPSGWQTRPAAFPPRTLHHAA